MPSIRHTTTVQRGGPSVGPLIVFVVAMAIALSPPRAQASEAAHDTTWSSHFGLTLWEALVDSPTSPLPAPIRQFIGDTARFVQAEAHFLASVCKPRLGPGDDDWPDLQGVVRAPFGAARIPRNNNLHNALQAYQRDYTRGGS